MAARSVLDPSSHPGKLKVSGASPLCSVWLGGCVVSNLHTAAVKTYTADVHIQR